MELWFSTALWSPYLIPVPGAPGSIPSILKKCSEEKIVDVAEVNQWHCLEESEQWPENVD